MTQDSKRVSDGYLSLEGGCDSGRAQNLIGRNQVAFAINTAFRGGWPTPRPGWRKINLGFGTDYYAEAAFKSGLFQVGEGYTSFTDEGSLISMHGGRVFRAILPPNGSDVNFRVQEITIPGDPNPANIPLAWGMQAENYFLISDDSTKNFIWNGAAAVRAGPTQIRPCRQMVYYMGRVWWARGREYGAGDIIFGPSGSASLGRVDSILYDTENQYLAEGGSFAVPSSSGNIMAFKPIANINTVLGQGELITFTQNSVFATLVPQDRATWKNTREPLQRMIQLANGGLSQAGVVNVNEDLFYRSPDGIRSLAYSVRNAGQWGNTPISDEMERILQNDPLTFMPYVSGVNFDNRMLMTASPGISQGHGTYFRCLCALDFKPITGIRAQTPPEWDGIWTGLRFLRIVTVRHMGVMRCFIYSLNGADEIELWELSVADKFDHDGTAKVRIKWTQESRSFDFGNKFDQKQLFSGDLFFDQVSGSCDFDVDYRPDGYPCWVDWEAWSECAKNEICVDEFGSCPTLPNFQMQYRPQRQLVQPADTFDNIIQRKFRIGFEFETRLTITGYCRQKQLRLNAHITQEPPWGRQLPAQVPRA